MFAYLYWNPKEVAFTFFNFSVYWYSIFFAIGFILGYYVFLYLLKKYLGLLQKQNKDIAKKITDRLTSYIVVATIIGARLGHILFYEDIFYYISHPWNIFNLREGGLASHGAAIFIILFIYIFSKKEKTVSFLSLLDLIAAPAALAGFFIRIGNFFNQEILGVATNVPWGVMFGSLQEVRHPVQLYEAFFYLILFFTLFFIKKEFFLKRGKMIGIFFIAIFSFRIFIEFFKVKQSFWISSGFLMGQYLSIPFIFLGIFFLFKKDNLLNLY